MDLCSQGCEMCRVGAAPLPETHLQVLLSKVPEWSLVPHQGVKAIQRVFKFRAFADALEFTNRVGRLAETEGHHPEIVTEWGKVTVTFWTHKIKGLHRSDFVMAAKTDKAYAEGFRGGMDAPHECVVSVRCTGRPR
jgi:4a-hydroxytetrahydrobiopterin dehydratase